MPRIVEYEAQNVALKPTDRGSEAAVQAGRVIRQNADETAALTEKTAQLVRQSGESIGQGIRAVGSGIADYVKESEKHDELQDISQLSAKGAKAHDDLHSSWLDATRDVDPNDQSVFDKFREGTLEPALNKLQDAAKTDAGKRYAIGLASEIRNTMNTNMVADMSTRAGVAVQKNLGDVVTNLSQLAQSNPAGLDSAHKQLDMAYQANIEAAGHNLDPRRAEELSTTLKGLHEQIDHSAAYGFMYGDAKTAMLKLNEVGSNGMNPTFKYMDGTQLATARNAAKVMQRGELEDQMRRIAFKKYQEDRASEARANQILAAMPIDPVTQLPTPSKDMARNLLADPTLKSAEKTALLGLSTRLTKENFETNPNPQLQNDLLKRTLLPPTAPDRTTVAEVIGHIGKDLTQAEGGFIIGQMHSEDGQATTRMLTEAKALIEHTIAPKNFYGISDPNAQARADAEQLRFSQEYQRRSQTESPFELLNPDSPNSMISKDKQDGWKKASAPASSAPLQIPGQGPAQAPAKPGGSLTGDALRAYQLLHQGNQ